MKTNARIQHQDLLYTPKDGTRYIVILHDGRRIEAEWIADASCFCMNGDQSVSVLRKEAFDWWPAHV